MQAFRSFGRLDGEPSQGREGQQQVFLEQSGLGGGAWEQQFQGHAGAEAAGRGGVARIWAEL